jgi:hypothetical protein
MSLRNINKSWLALALAILPALLPWLRHPLPELKLEDFGVYYTAASLARGHQGAAIYSGADEGKDPQLVYADPHTIFAQSAEKEGVRPVRLYVYPPILADALVPLTFAPLFTADRIWIGLNYAALAVVALLIANLIEIPLLSLGTLALFVGLLAAQPVVSCLTWGQVTIALLLLWVLGAWLYKRGYYSASAFVFALAAVIKLTPLIVIIPFIVWREWRWLRSFAVSIFLLGGSMCILNKPSTLVDYFAHVMPSMSRGVPSKSNESLLAAIQMVYVSLRGGIASPVTMPIPHLVITAGKVVCVVTLVIAIASTVKLGKTLSQGHRVMVLALFAMLSAPVSPVSWPHAYAVCLFAMSLLWAQALRENRLTTKLGLLVVTTLAVTSYLFPFAITYLVNHSRYELLISLLALVTPASVILIVLASLRVMRAPAAIAA